MSNHKVMHHNPTDEEIGHGLAGLEAVVWAQTLRDKRQAFRGGKDSLRDAIGDTLDRRIKEKGRGQ